MRKITVKIGKPKPINANIEEPKDVEAVLRDVTLRRTSGTTNHDELTGRDLPNQHPMSSIEGLGLALDKKQPVGNYALKKEIPSKTSELENDNEFITKTVSDLVNYYAKQETYSREEIDNKISSIPKFSIEVVSSLPTANISDTTVYLVASGNEEDNLYTEYIYVNGVWEYLGKQTVDLTGYVKRTELSSYYTKTDIDALIETIRSSIPTKLSQLTEDASHRLVSDSEKQSWNNKQPAGDYVTNTELNAKGYAKQDDVSKLSEEIVNQRGIIDGKQPIGNYLTEIPSEYITEEELDAEIEDLKVQLNQKTLLFAEGDTAKENIEWLENTGDTSEAYIVHDETDPDIGWFYRYKYTEVTVEPTNAIPTATDTDRKTIYNGIGYKSGMRINSSGAVVEQAGNSICVSGFIPVKVGDTLEVRNLTRNSSYAEYVVAYNSSNTVTGKVQTSGAASPYVSLTDFDVPITSSTFGTGFDAVRISGIITANTSIIVRSADGGTVSEYKWTNTGFAFVPADYEERIIELEREVATLEKASKGQNALGISEVFAPSPQLPADGSATADFNGDRDSITAEQIYAKIDELLNLYPRFITKEVMGKDESGTHDWCRYTLSKRAYDAWQKPNYPPMYAWVNGSTVIYSVSVSPRIGDTMYTTKYVGTAKGTVTAVSNANQTRTVGGVVYTRDKTKDVEPTLVYTETAYSPYFSSNYAGWKNGIYDSTKAKISTISSIDNGTMTGANGGTYTRYPLGDRNSKFEELPAIVIGGNEHGTGGDPATPAMINARMIKDLCECKNADNPLLNLLKNEYMMVFCPVVNPWGLHKDNKDYYNSNGVNLDRNFDTIGWVPQAEEPSNFPTGDYGGSENETQYFMNTLVASKCKIAMCNHSYGHGIDSKTGEAVSGGICSYMFGRNKSKYTESLLKIAEVMASNYNLVFNDNGEAPPENWAKTRSYFEWIGVDGIALEINSRDGFVTDPNNVAQGKQFTARVMEAGYTQLLQALYMLIDKLDS